ncbi:MAG: CcmD family protein [Ignavibacteriales bacterium]|nr:CcmD family protein [Ignavibacteriales bacterium]
MNEFLSQNALYIVLIIVLIVWTGIFGFMWSLEKRLTKLEREQKNEK